MHNLLHNIVCILMRIGAIVIVMQIDTRDLISATDLTRNTAQLIRDAAEGRRFVVMNNSVPRAALIGIADLELLAAAASKDQRQHKVTAGLTRDELMDSIDPHEWTATKAQRRAEGRPMLLIPLGLSETDAVAAARAHPKVSPHLDGKSLSRVIYVPGKILNLVIG